MHKKSDKKRLYWLIDMYLSGDIDESTFCDEFYLSYNVEIDTDTLTQQEAKAFSELRKVSSRFSDSKVDHQKYPGVYRTKEELKQKILETKNKLKNSET